MDKDQVWETYQYFMAKLTGAFPAAEASTSAAMLTSAVTEVAPPPPAPEPPPEGKPA
jgi:hypothetical protein